MASRKVAVLEAMPPEGALSGHRLTGWATFPRPALPTSCPFFSDANTYLADINPIDSARDLVTLTYDLFIDARADGRASE